MPGLNAFTANFSWLQLAAGFGLAGLIALAAYAARSLSASGALAATLLGGIMFGLGGLPWAALLIGFFASSSILSRLFKGRKTGLNEKYSKGSRRDASQVFANGGVAGLLVILLALFPAATWLWACGAAALAAANADTWATELGVLNKSRPRLITTWKAVEKGTSGGISLAGTLAALAGAGLIALLAVIFWPESAGEASLVRMAGRFGVITLAGLGGSLVDSLLGATLQAIYYCPACDKETEHHPLHTCGTHTRQMRGLVWLNNDAVNWACALSGAALALTVAL